MAQQFDSEIVESPITTAKIETAMATVRTAIAVSGPIELTSFNQGRSILVSTSIDA